ncbi:MAG: ferrous iron transport protein B [Ignavibacterium album]|uniref:ferrous iron transport protein B n=1 Tax=Ignavibacterium album TaxID=591197 RepID=UPI0026F2C2E3|nr:ferrous iron transport protein B [Ignavibacterium album]MCX8106857.1 ferrous iron transport protein B [Ignavibacterium album]
MIPDVAKRTPLITLVGPPNSGKTTLFNYLSGKNFKTVNYPGSTVEYYTCKMQDKFNIEANLLDSPGIISLNPNSPDEEVTINSLYNHPEYGAPDLIIATADASQLSRHLLLTKQLLIAGFRVILVLTMRDLLEKKGVTVNIEKLSKMLRCDVVFVNGRTGQGINELIKKLDKNINDVESVKNFKPIYVAEQLSKENLLDLYSEIENLIKAVIEPIEIPNLDSVNKKIKILNPVLQEPTLQPDLFTLKLDKFLLHKRYGLIFFFLIMTSMFTSIFWLADPFMTLVDNLFSFLAGTSSDFLGNTWYSHLISDGLISGIGSVMVFLPQILILFLILGLLEDTGYLARGAMMIDKPLSKIGLNGKSFVPMLSGFACAIPAMLAARTISNRRERLLTIFIIPLMSCSARLPVYALLVAFLTPSDKPWLGGILLASIYLFGIISSVIVASIINKFSRKLIRAEDNSSFILELPAYRIPKLKVVLKNSYVNALHYIKRAGPIILFLSLIIWFLTYMPNHSPQIDTTGLNKDEIIQLEKSERLATSYAADLGKFIQPLMTPLGMDWRIGVSLIAAFAAREVFVSSLALIFRVTDDENIQSSLLTAMQTAKNQQTGEPLFTTATVIGLIVFFVFALQCISTLAVSKKETGSWRIPILQLLIFTSTAYLFTFIVVNGLRLVGIN